MRKFPRETFQFAQHVNLPKDVCQKIEFVGLGRSSSGKRGLHGVVIR